MTFTGPPPMHPYYDVGGLDISHHQSNVNWDVAKSVGAGFVIIRCANALATDRNYFTHTSNAKSNGVPYGVYYYFHPYYDQAACAKKVVDVIGRAWPTLGLYIDMEKNAVDRWPTDATPQVVTAQALRLLSILDKEYGRPVGIYTSSGWWGKWIVPAAITKFNLYRRQLWVANWRYTFSRYIAYPSMWPRDKVLFWQFSAGVGPYGGKAALFGVTGSRSVDCNVFLKSRDMFKTVFGVEPAA